MGPRLCSRGDGGDDTHTTRARGELQWGRGFVAAETGAYFIAPISRDSASMGPRLCSRGDGLRLCSRGDKGGCFNGAAAL